MTEMLGLAILCEMLTGWSRELDGDIALAIGWEPDHQSSLRWAGTYPSRREEWVNDGGQAFDNWKVPRYTGSIDAAVTVVPENWFWQVGQTTIFFGWAKVYQMHPDHTIEGDSEFYSNCEHHKLVKIPPINCLLACALRARASKAYRIERALAAALPSEVA